MIAVDAKQRAIVLSCTADGPSSSGVKMLREVLDRFESLTAIPLIADKGYDAVDRIEKLKALGCEPAIAMKETWRMKIQHPLRKLSQQGWEKYGRRHRIEGVFGSAKRS